MYCVSYRFKLLSDNSETRRQFIAVWSGVTDFFRDDCGALGSRLHYGDDGAFYAYAQWPSREVMAGSQEVMPSVEFTALRMKWSELCGPSEVLWQGETVADLLVQPA